MLTKEERHEFINLLKEKGIFYILEADVKYRDDEKLMKGLLKLNAALISCATDRLKNNEELLEIVLKKPSDRLGTTGEKRYGFAIEFVNKECLKKHPETVLLFLRENMEYASVLGMEILTENKKIYNYVLENIDREPMLWLYLPEDDRKYEKKVVMKVINAMPAKLGKMPLELQCDLEVVAEAARDHLPEYNSVVAMYSCMDPIAKENPEICKLLFKIDPRVFPYLKYQDETMIDAAEKYFGYIPELDNKENSRTAIKKKINKK